MARVCQQITVVELVKPWKVAPATHSRPPHDRIPLQDLVVKVAQLGVHHDAVAHLATETCCFAVGVVSAVSAAAAAGGGCQRRTAARGHPHGTARRRVPTTPLSPRNHASYAFAHQRLDHALLGLAIKLQRPAVHVMVALEDDPGARGRDGNRLACSHCKTKRAVDLPRAVVGVVELTCVCSKISV